MLLSDRRSFLLGALALSGCGFAPVHGQKGTVALRNSVLVQAPQTRDEFELVRALEHRLGQASDATYTLNYALNVVEEAVVVSINQVQSRFNVIGEMQYTLADTNGDAVVSGTSKAFTGYSSTGSIVSTDRSQRDARNRLMVLLADQTITRIIADLSP